MKFSKNVFLGLMAATMMAMPLVAEEQEIVKKDEQQAVASYKQLNPGQEIEETENKETTVVHGAGHKTTHNGSNHVYVGTTLFGDQIEMEDGSYWLTNPGDRYKLQGWYSGDPIIVMQNSAWFGKPQYPYKIYNERSYESVEVELSAAPIWDSFYRRFIIEIYKPEFGDGYLKLNDGSLWILDNTYKNVWGLWLVNDTMIIGTNDSMFSFFTPDLLINVTCSVQCHPSKCTN